MREYLYRKLAIDLPAQRLECCTSKLIGAAIPEQDGSASRKKETAASHRGQGEALCTYQPTSTKELNWDVMAGVAVEMTARSRKKRK